MSEEEKSPRLQAAAAIVARDLGSALLMMESEQGFSAAVVSRDQLERLTKQLASTLADWDRRLAEARGRRD